MPKHSVYDCLRIFTGTDINVREGELVWYNERGEVIQDLLRVERPINPAPPAESELEDVELRAVVKFFNDIRGYGFVTPKGIAEDALVHSRVLNDCGVHSLIQGQKLLIKVDDTGKGPQVQALRLLNE
jgi:cold shock CspA family protein